MTQRNCIPRDATMIERSIAKKAPPMLDIHGRETGWKAVPVENGDGTVLVSIDGKTAVQFFNPERGSGTEAFRQRVLAQCYAIDHPYVAERPLGELVVAPLFSSTNRPRGSENAAKSNNGKCQGKTAMTDHVTRYVVTHINKEGMRTLCGPAQGRNTHETAEDAQDHLDAMMQNNRMEGELLAGVYGLPLEVRPVKCYPGHFDPMGIYFSEGCVQLGR